MRRAQEWRARRATLSEPPPHLQIPLCRPPPPLAYARQFTPPQLPVIATNSPPTNSLEFKPLTRAHINQPTRQLPASRTARVVHNCPYARHAAPTHVRQIHAQTSQWAAKHSTSRIEVWPPMLPYSLATARPNWSAAKRSDRPACTRSGPTTRRIDRNRDRARTSAAQESRWQDRHARPPQAVDPQAGWSRDATRRSPE